MAYSANPGAAQPQAPRRRKPSAARLVIGILLVAPLSAVAAVAAGWLTGGSGTVEDLTNAETFQPGDIHSQTLAADTEYTIWSTSGAASTYCEVMAPDGDMIETYLAGDENSTVGELSFDAGVSFHSTGAGSYTMACDSVSPAAVFMVTEPLGRRLVTAIVSAVAAGTIVALIGIVMIIVYAVKRSRWSREQRTLAAPYGYGYPPPAAAPYAAPGYQGQPYQGQPGAYPAGQPGSYPPPSPYPPAQPYRPPSDGGTPAPPA
jgi:hypothetical protein